MELDYAVEREKEKFILTNNRYDSEDCKDNKHWSLKCSAKNKILKKTEAMKENSVLTTHCMSTRSCLMKQLRKTRGEKYRPNDNIPKFGGNYLHTE